MKDERMPTRKSDEPVVPTHREPVRSKPVAAGPREPKPEADERTPEEAGYGYGV